MHYIKLNYVNKKGEIAMKSAIVTFLMLSWILMGIGVDHIPDQNKRARIAWFYVLVAIIVAVVILILF